MSVPKSPFCQPLQDKGFRPFPKTEVCKTLWGKGFGDCPLRPRNHPRYPRNFHKRMAASLTSPSLALSSEENRPYYLAPHMSQPGSPLPSQ